MARLKGLEMKWVPSVGQMKWPVPTGPSRMTPQLPGPMTLAAAGLLRVTRGADQETKARCAARNNQLRSGSNVGLGKVANSR